MLKRQLDIQVQELSHITVISLIGAVDPSNVEDFKRKLTDACSVKSARVLLDCANLSYVNSQSLGLLFHYHRMCETNGGQLALCEVWDKIQNILRLLGMDSVLKIYGTREEALMDLQLADKGP